MAQKKRITVVNDYPEFLQLLVDFLTLEEFEVIPIAKHQGAFEQIKESHPDVVVCDLIFENEPHGWALLDMLYLDPQTRSIPLVLCSAATKQVQEVVPSLASKGIIWLEKPFEIEKLVAILRDLTKEDRKPQITASSA